MKFKNPSTRFVLIFVGVAVCVLAGIVLIQFSDSRSRRSVSLLRIESFDRIVLERSGCYGSCPIYKLAVSGNGEVTFEGKDFVNMKGEVTDRISDRQLGDLVEALNRAAFFGLRDSYVSELDGCWAVASDQATVITTVVTPSRSKTVRHYLGCVEADDDLTYPEGVHPRALSDLEIEIDRIVGSGKWISEK